MTYQHSGLLRHMKVIDISTGQSEHYPLMICEPDQCYLCHDEDNLPDPRIESPTATLPFVHKRDLKAWTPLKKWEHQPEPAVELLFQPGKHDELRHIPPCKRMWINLPEGREIVAAVCWAESCDICKGARGLNALECWARHRTGWEGTRPHRVYANEQRAHSTGRECDAACSQEIVHRLRQGFRTVRREN